MRRAGVFAAPRQPRRGGCDRIDSLMEEVVMLKGSRHVSSSLLGVGCAIGLAAAGAPAFGQGSGGFTVMGHNRTPAAQDLSAAVSYRDLDLTTRGARDALRARVWRTA